MFKKIGNFLHRIFSGTDRFVKKHVVPAIKSVEALKIMVDGPLGDAVKALLPKRADKLDASRASLSNALDGLNLAYAISSADSLEGKLYELQKWLQLQPKALRDAVLFKIASTLAKDSAKADGMDVGGSGIEMLIMAEYLNQKNKLGETYAAEAPAEKPVTAKAEKKGT